MRWTPLLFITIAYALSIALSAFIAFTGRADSPYIGAVFAAMFIPAVALLLTRSSTGEKIGELGFSRLPLLYLLPALLLIPLASHAAMLPTIYLLQGDLPWVDWLTPGADGLHRSPASRGWGDITTAQLAERIALNAGVGLAIVSLLALFEEIGWRAWLLPRLARSFGPIGAVWAVSIVWALWHTPFAFSGIHNVETMSPSQLALIAPLGHIGAGLVLGWLWLRSQSIWIVSLAHGALNNWGQLAFKYMDGFGQHDAWLLGAQGVALLVTGSLLLLLAPPTPVA
jgi:uncharacterized protein